MLPYEYRAGINSATQTRFIFINLTHRIFDLHHIHGSQFAIVDVFPRNISQEFFALCIFHACNGMKKKVTSASPFCNATRVDAVRSLCYF